MSYTEEYLKKKLIKELDATHVEVIDESDGCGAKFSCVIVSDKFEGKSLLQRHRLVNSTLQEELKNSLDIDVKNFSKSRIDNAFSITLSVPGKVILFGEHSVVHGKLAIAASLGLRTKLTFTEHKLTEVGGNKITINLHSINLLQCYDFEDLQTNLLRKADKIISFDQPEAVNHEDFREIIDEFIKKTSGSAPLTEIQYNALFSIFHLFLVMVGSSDIHVNPFSMDIETDLTIGAGLGSSASLMVAVAAAFHRYIRHKSSKNDDSPGMDSKNIPKVDLDLISRWAFTAEKIIHGTPSGLDNTICTFGSVVEFRRNSPLKLMELRNRLQILLVNTKVPKDTKALVARVAVLKEKYPDVVNNILEAMEGISIGALEELLKLDELYSSEEDSSEESKNKIAEAYSRLGDLVHFNQQLLRSLQVSHPTLDTICSMLQEAGLSAKLTGGGGGGYAFAIIPNGFDKVVLEQAVGRLNDHGFETILTNLGGSGLVFD